jgi:hypothetical protein
MSQSGESLRPDVGMQQIFGVSDLMTANNAVSANALNLPANGAVPLHIHALEESVQTSNNEPTQEARATNPFKDYHAPPLPAHPFDDSQVDSTVGGLFDNSTSLELADLSHIPHSTAPFRTKNNSPLRPAAMLLTLEADSSSGSKRAIRKPSQTYISAQGLPAQPARTSSKDKQRRKRKKGTIGWNDSASGEASSSTEDESLEKDRTNGSDMVLCTPAEVGDTSEVEEPTQQAEEEEMPPLAESSRSRRNTLCTLVSS